MLPSKAGAARTGPTAGAASRGTQLSLRWILVTAPRIGVALADRAVHLLDHVLDAAIDRHLPSGPA
ncbi:hypothetical protein MA3A0930S_0717 [Mycobacteroides abscessus 3A-0930-S]|nr:hypothetical protein MA6G0125S_1133 [Mycobacteroides abscessus 6G-0125-S]EIU50886.1 hypothetical protein MA6G0125R_0162 [Mycobacteroides abscessus 6G-0125-R]EIU56434.1 hypothetical protein MA6G0728S_1460 [Mycobacteroides abscessus 6G-0728-S]EIU66191.1 hypothetical protein MA6G1108_1119 [Mycobacteroides abscessus 6G-1108]EIU97800.1 hypothetical protein MA6G0212_1190 [Mycobacteroides abscessus 6G-0212]EIV26518.1 hypothetical protein MA3A0122R_3638 [Mycobacteroides abscessus 3A-0122-R]EIV4199